eukprot:2475852-Amphidinium_carterae.1
MVHHAAQACKRGGGLQQRNKPNDAHNTYPVTVSILSLTQGTQALSKQQYQICGQTDFFLTDYVGLSSGEPELRGCPTDRGCYTEDISTAHSLAVEIVTVVARRL